MLDPICNIKLILFLGCNLPIFAGRVRTPALNIFNIGQTCPTGWANFAQGQPARTQRCGAWRTPCSHLGPMKGGVWVSGVDSKYFVMSGSDLEIRVSSVGLIILSVSVDQNLFWFECQCRVEKTQLDFAEVTLAKSRPCDSHMWHIYIRSIHVQCIALRPIPTYCGMPGPPCLSIFT